MFTTTRIILLHVTAVSVYGYAHTFRMPRPYSRQGGNKHMEMPAQGHHPHHLVLLIVSGLNVIAQKSWGICEWHSSFKFWLSSPSWLWAQQPRVGASQCICASVYWCIRRSGSESCTRFLQGKYRYLGAFPDALSAAICYDRERIRLHGAKGFLNFPSGSNHSQRLRSTPSQPAMLGAMGAPCQEGLTNKKVLPLAVAMVATQCLSMQP